MAKLKKRADGRYQRKLTLRDGRQKVVYGRTLAELNAAANTLREQDNAGLIIGDHTTVGAWAKLWLTNYKTDLRAATVNMYRSAYNNHIRQPLGLMELRDVRPVHVRAVMSSVAGSSDSLQHKVLLTMRQLFGAARDNHLILDDPTRGVKPTPHAKPPAKKYLTPAEAAQLMQAVTDPRARVFCALCLYCGLRREEALGLQWADVGPDRLTVNRTRTFLANRPDPVDELKSKAAHRVLPIPAPLQEILAATPRVNKYVVTAADGSDTTRSSVRRMLEAHVSGQVPFCVTPHMLRHTYATTLYRAGVDLRTAQHLMGHSSIQMTADIYTHLDHEDNLAAIKPIDEYLASEDFLSKSSQKVVRLA